MRDPVGLAGAIISRACGESCRDGGGEIGETRRLKQRPNRNLDTELGARPVAKFGGKDGVPAEVEEVIAWPG